MGATWDPAPAAGRRRGHRERARAPPAGAGTSPRSRTSRGTTGGAATTRPGPRSRRWPARWARRTSRGLQGGAQRAAEASPPRSSTSPATRSRSTATTGSRPQLPIRYLQDTFLPSYAGGIDAGAATVMVDSGSINGIPATASHFLLTDRTARPARLQRRGDQRLRRRAGAGHHLPHRRRPRRRDRQGGQRRRRHVHDALRLRRLAGRADRRTCSTAWCPSERIDQAVRRILHAEVPARPVRPPVRRRRAKADAAVDGRPGRHARRRPRSRSPCCATRTTRCRWRRTAKVVVTGPSADSMTNQLGGWSVSWQGVFGAGHVCCMGPAGPDPAGHHGAQGPAGRGPERRRTRPDQAAAVARRGVRRCGRRRRRREGVRRGARATTRRRHCRPTSRR